MKDSNWANGFIPCLELPRKVIGRKPKRNVNKAYKRICEGKGGLVLVSGYAGTGKQCW